MAQLSQEIKEKFYLAIKGSISLYDFEQWLYANKDLEGLLVSDDYLDLISLNFQKSGAKYELWKLLRKHIDLGEFETYKMLELLKQTQNKTHRLPYILMEFYDLYCNGYSFLQDLGLGFGLAVKVPQVDNRNANSWSDLTTNEKTELLNGFSPQLEVCVDQVIYWLVTKKIILTGDQDEFGAYGYIDLRTDKERESILG